MDKICKDCGGELSENCITLQTGCENYNMAFPCSLCGRLHWGSGEAVKNWRYEKVFFLNGKVVDKKINRKK